MEYHRALADENAPYQNDKYPKRFKKSPHQLLRLKGTIPSIRIFEGFPESLTDVTVCSTHVFTLEWKPLESEN